MPSLRARASQQFCVAINDCTELSADKMVTAANGESGRIKARTGFRMMPTFPRSSLQSVRQVFPQYGWKAGFPSGVFQDYRCPSFENRIPAPLPPPTHASIINGSVVVTSSCSTILSGIHM
jgi:hypothetical protein